MRHECVRNTLRLTLAVIVFGNFPLTLSSSTARAYVAPSTPRIRCEIRMARWCIATFDGEISMATNDGSRIWTLMSKTSAKGSALHIVEDKSCIAETAPEPAPPALLYERVQRGFHVEAYRLGNNGCILEFNWLEVGTQESRYRQVVDYGIIIDPDSDPKQLYKFKPSVSTGHK